jgi:CubicO group peptidase (beta-lactamase class C family)/PKD repeat protein
MSTLGQQSTRRSENFVNIGEKVGEVRTLKGTGALGGSRYFWSVLRTVTTGIFDIKWVLIIGACFLLMFAGTAAAASDPVGESESIPKENPTTTIPDNNTAPPTIGAPEEPERKDPTSIGKGSDDSVSPDGISPSSTSTIQGNYTIDRTPQNIGKVNITYNVTIPNDVDGVAVRLNYPGRPDYSVVSTDGFSYNPSEDRWDAINKTQASLTYTIDANTTFGLFGSGKETVETNEWALLGPSQLRFGRFYFSNSQAEFKETGSAVGEGYVGSDQNFAFLGSADTFKKTARGQELTLVVPDAANPNTTVDNILSNFTAASKFLQVGDRDPKVTAFVAPDPMRRGGRATGSSFWAQEEASAFVLIHEYVHTRQAWIDADLPSDEDSTIEWITEGSANYYGGYLGWELNGRSNSQRFRNYLNTSQNSTEVLKDPDSDSAELKNYNKGRRVLGALDIRIRQNTDGNQNLTTIFRRLNAKDGTFSYSDFKNEAVSLTNSSTDRWLDKYVTTSSAPPIPQDIESAYSSGSVSTDGLNVTNVTSLNDPIVEEDELQVAVEVENTGSSSVEENVSLNVFANETRSVLGADEQKVSVSTGETKEVVLTYGTQVGDSGNESGVVVQGVTETDSEGANDTAGVIALDLWNEVTGGDGELAFFDTGTAIQEFHDDGQINGTEFTLRDVNLFALYYEKVNGRSVGEALHARDKAPENYRNMDKVFPSNSVEAGGNDNVWELNEAGQSVNLPETYTYNGENSVADYLNRTGTTGIVVAQNDTVINETYYRGYNASSKATSWSVAKSFTSALTMRALQNESVSLSLEDNVTKYLPELNGSGYENAKVKHVLTMSSGAEGTHFGRTGGNYRNASIPSRAYFNNESLLEQFSGYDSQFSPGTDQNYLNSDTAVLGLVLEEATGQQLNRYLEEEIWKPVGMEGDTFWLTDNEGTDIGMCCLNAKLRDYTRFGLLYLNEGRRTDTGEQIIPANLVNQSTQPQGSGIGGVGYGYSWWVPSENEFAAIGLNGQYVYVNETEDIVITKTSTDIDYTSDPEHLAFFRAVSTLESKETEEPSFAVNITDTNSTVTEGETLTVDVNVTNIGGTLDTQEVNLTDFDGVEQDSVNVTLGSGESNSSITLNWTTEGDNGTGDVTVFSENDSDTQSVTVNERAFFDVNIAGTNSPVTEGDTLTVNVNVTNTGDETATQTLNLTDTGFNNVEQDTVDVTLNGGEFNNSITLDWSTSDGDRGTGDVTVFSENDSDTETVTVNESAFFDVNITGTNSPVTEGDTLEVTANVTNTGDESGTQNVTLDVGALGTDSTAISLPSGASTTEALSVGTGTGDAGSYTATVSSDNDTASTPVEVQEQQQPANFTVSIRSTNSPVTEGDTLEVTAKVTNTGDESDTQTITLSASALGTNSTDVSLNGDSSKTVILSVGTGAGDAGSYTATVSSDNDTDSTNVTVEKPATSSLSNLDIAGQGTDATITESTDEEVSVTVTNVGDQAGSFNATLEIGTAVERNTSTGELSPEGDQILTFENVTGGLTPGDYSINISTADDEIGGNLTVQEQQQPANFTVNITGTNLPVTEGEILEVTVSVTNTGDEKATQTLNLTDTEFNNNEQDTVDVTLNGGESNSSITLDWTTEQGDNGTGDVTVFSENDSDTQSVTVNEAGQTTSAPDCSKIGYDGAGTASNPYEVTNVKQLQCMGDSATSTSLNADFRQTTDIDASGTSSWNNGDGFDPVGDSTTPFTGTFEGSGHTITALYVDRGGESNVGLFGWSNGTITNVSVVDLDVAGSVDVGGLVGYNRGTVESSYATGDVNGSDRRIGGLVGQNDEGTVRSSNATVNVSGGDEVGGLVGLSNDATVKESHAASNVSGSTIVGGLVGTNVLATINKSYATGNVSGSNLAGGLVGFNNFGGVRESYATAAVSGDGDVGGLVGGNSGTVNSSNATGTVSGNSSIGGLVGDNSGTVNSSNATGTVSGDFDIGGLVGYNDRTVAWSNATGTVSGSGDRVGGLVGLNDGGTVNGSYATGNVSGSGSVGGLVGLSNGTVRWSNATGIVTGTGDRVGGLAGFNNGTVRESYATGSASGVNRVGGLVGNNGRAGTANVTYATASVSGDDRVGGLVGQNNGGEINESYAAGTVSGSNQVGGLVGLNNAFLGASVTNSYWNTETTDQSTGSVGTGLTTSEMLGDAAKTNMGGFDFARSWAVFDNGTEVSYPYLQNNTQQPEPGLLTNDVPSISGDLALSTDEGTAVTLTSTDLEANDPDDGDSDLTHSVTSAPAKGTIEVSGSPATSFTEAELDAGNVEYVHDGSETTSDSFDVEVSDDDGAESSIKTVSVSVNPVNDAPTAQDQTYSKAENTNTLTRDVVALAGDDVDDPESALDVSSIGGSGSTSQTAAVTAAHLNTQVTLTASIGSNPDTIEFTPGPNIDALDTVDGTKSFAFDYRIEDDDGAQSAVNTITVEVTGENDPPTASNDADSTTEDTSVTVDVVANDTDVDDAHSQLDVTAITNGPSHGTAQITGASNDKIEFTPGPGATSDVQITYELNDDNGAMDTATLSVTVNAVNTAPTANDDSDTTDEGQPTTTDVLSNDTDPDGSLDTSTVTVQSGPSDGSVSVDDTTGAITYTPDSGFTGTDSYTYTVNDDDGAESNEATVTITVDAANTPPTASFTFSPNSPDTSDAVTFDASVSSDSDGNIRTYEWDFGDGTTATGQSTSHSYSTSGTYTVTLTVTDNEGATDTMSKIISVVEPNLPVEPNSPPTAAFTFAPPSPSTSDTVSFDGSFSSDLDGTIRTYEWDFGDGTTATGKTATKSYSSSGIYTVTLTVMDDEGATDTTSKTISVAEPNSAPTASFTFLPSSPSTSDTVSFDGSGSSDPDGTIRTYEWDFGDGTTATGEMSSHSYGSTGTFTVTLTVTDNEGATNTTTKTVDVKDLFTNPLPGFNNPPQNTEELDPNLYEDVDGDGDGRAPSEAVLLWSQLVQNPRKFDDLTQEQIDALDWNGDGSLTLADAVILWSKKVQA